MSDWAIRVPPRPPRWYHRAGLSSRTERAFGVLSSVFVLVIAIGWSWSIATARPAATNGDSLSVAPNAAAIAAAITETDGTSTAYLTDAVLNALVPLRGESGRLR